MEIRKKIQFTARDLQKGYQAHLLKFHPFRTWWPIVTGGILLVIGLLLNVLDPKHQYEGSSLFCIIYGIFLTSLGYYRIRSVGKRLYRKMEDYQKPVLFTFREEQIRIKTATQNASVTWDHFVKALITKDMVLLYPNEVSFYVFHRNHFTSGENDSFRSLVKRKVAKVYGDKTNASATPQTAG